MWVHAETPAVSASTPQGCIWNPATRRRHNATHASTPQGCIWNRETRRKSVRARRFNPTRVHLEPSCSLVCPGLFTALQPHKGASGTRLLVGGVDSGLLQPHKGASGTARSNSRRGTRIRFNPTRVHLEQQGRTRVVALGFASTPQGCIWNGDNLGDSVAMIDASTPQGCIWNRGPVHRGIESLSFNPTRVYLERHHSGFRGSGPAGRFNPTRVHLEPTG